SIGHRAAGWPSPARAACSGIYFGHLKHLEPPAVAIALSASPRRAPLHDPTARFGWSEVVMDLGLGGRAALITGASKGIGKAIARALAEEGVHVALLARTADEVQAAASE